jgi:hypothetical protein
VRLGENGRAGEIRTHDLLHPMQARYQATLQPEQKKGHKAAWGWPKQVVFHDAESRGAMIFCSSDRVDFLASVRTGAAGNHGVFGSDSTNGRPCGYELGNHPSALF